MLAVAGQTIIGKLDTTINSDNKTWGDSRMSKKLLVCISFLSSIFLSGAVFAEDAVTADPKHYTVEFENDRVRVIRIKYGPGEKSVMHSHGPNVAVFLSDSTVRMTLPDGSSMDIEAKTGGTQWADAEEHLPENLDDEPMEVVLVELKD